MNSVFIPDSVTTIGCSAFAECKGLFSVRFPNGLTEIAEFLFSYCKDLTNVQLPDSVEAIKFMAFAKSGIKSLTVNKDSKLRVIGRGAFWDCSRLEHILLPSRKIQMYYTSFSGDKKLNDLTVTYVFPDGIRVTEKGRNFSLYKDPVNSPPALEYAAIKSAEQNKEITHTAQTVSSSTVPEKAEPALIALPTETASAGSDRIILEKLTAQNEQLLKDNSELKELCREMLRRLNEIEGKIQNRKKTVTFYKP